MSDAADKMIRYFKCLTNTPIKAFEEEIVLTDLHEDNKAAEASYLFSGRVSVVARQVERHKQYQPLINKMKNGK